MMEWLFANATRYAAVWAAVILILAAVTVVAGVYPWWTPGVAAAAGYGIIRGAIAVAEWLLNRELRRSRRDREREREREREWRRNYG